jgi:hypothetical protein
MKNEDINIRSKNRDDEIAKIIMDNANEIMKLLNELAEIAHIELHEDGNSRKGMAKLLRFIHQNQGVKASSFEPNITNVKKGEENIQLELLERMKKKFTSENYGKRVQYVLEKLEQLNSEQQGLIRQKGAKVNVKDAIIHLINERYNSYPIKKGSANFQRCVDCRESYLSLERYKELRDDQILEKAFVNIFIAIAMIKTKDQGFISIQKELIKKAQLKITRKTDKHFTFLYVNYDDPANLIECKNAEDPGIDMKDEDIKSIFKDLNKQANIDLLELFFEALSTIDFCWDSLPRELSDKKRPGKKDIHYCRVIFKDGLNPIYFNWLFDN